MHAHGQVESATGGQRAVTSPWILHADSLRPGSGRLRPDPGRKLSANLYDIYHCCVYSEKFLLMNKRNCPKHVEIYTKNKFEKLVILFVFIIRVLSGIDSLSHLGMNLKNSFAVKIDLVHWQSFKTIIYTFPLL
jgi:hypothetical protein